MWQSEEEQERRKMIEKLIDWEVNKQLRWTIAFLTAVLGLLGLLFSGAFKQWIVFSKFPLVTINFVKAPFVIIFFLLLFGIDVSFYRLAYSLARLRNWEEMLPESERKELVEKAPLRDLYGLFVKRIDEKRFSLRASSVWLLIVLADVLMILTLFSV